jgi:hypothetical protein
MTTTDTPGLSALLTTGTEAFAVSAVDSDNNREPGNRRVRIDTPSIAIFIEAQHVAPLVMQLATALGESAALTPDDPHYLDTAVALARVTFEGGDAA